MTRPRRPPPRPSIISFVTAPEFLGLSLSPAQRTLLKSIYGEALDAGEVDIWRSATGRDAYPARAFGEVVVVAGARSGKDSRIAVPVLMYEALFGGHVVSKGERPVYPLVAQDLRATRIAFTYLKEYLERSAILRQEIVAQRAAEIELRNGATISCFPCTVTSLRGWSIPCGVMDELGYWRLEGAADSDAEVQTSIRRGGLGFAHPRLVKISTPYQRSGVLYDDFTRHHGKDTQDVLVWRASTATMNPTITPERLARERRLDPVRFAREYEAEFSAALQALFDPESLDAATVRGRRELPPLPGVRHHAFADPAGGGGSDSFTLGIGHEERMDGGEAVTEFGGWDPHHPDPVVRELAWSSRRAWSRSPRRLVVDALRAWKPPFSPEAVVREASELLKLYRVRAVVGDRFSGTFASEAFSRHGISYSFSQENRSELYLGLLSAVNSGRVELLDHAESLRQLRALERRTTSQGRDLIDHPRGSHDDLANSIAGLSAKTVRPQHVFERIAL